MNPCAPAVVVRDALNPFGAVVYHHQSEAGVLMPMTLACMKAAKKVTMDHMETARGMGWWGDNSTRDYYENLETDLNPLTFIKTVPLMDAQAQIDCGGFDHAGKFETSLLSAVYPENVDFERAAWNTEWFAIPAKDASPELGEKMAALAIEYLKKTII